MRKLYSGLSIRDASVQLQAWLEPEAEGAAKDRAHGRVISLCAFRAETEIASERHRLARSETRGLSELVPALLAELDSRIGSGQRLH
ncbi:MAG: hypothetical protein Q8M37_07000 [Nevskia sp.]|nr:hypothetical protein [Nevskia sp.]